MVTVREVEYPENMVRAAAGEPSNWAESTIRSTVDYIEDYARSQPLTFAVWAFGIGFALGWKLKPW
jgi:hypothetical protein